MPKFVFRDGHWRDHASGELMVIPKRDGLCVPMLIPDVSEYASPIDGTPISSRSVEREELKRHDCVILPPKKREYKNPSFMAKHGIAPDGRKDLSRLAK